MRKRKRLNCVSRFQMSEKWLPATGRTTPPTRFGQAPPGHHQAGYRGVTACPFPSLPRRCTTTSHPAHRQVGALIHIMERAIHLRRLHPLSAGIVQRFAVLGKALTRVVTDGLPVGAVNTGTLHRLTPMRYL